MSERSQSLLQYCNVVQIARLVFYKTMDPTLHYKMKVDEAYDGTVERLQPSMHVQTRDEHRGLDTLTETLSIHTETRCRIGDTETETETETDRKLSVLVVNIETDAQTE